MDTIKQSYIKEIERIEGLPEAQRWREIKTLLLKVNPDLKPLDDQFIIDLKQSRDEQANEFGSSKDRSLRLLIDMPRYLYDALIVTDPTFSEQLKDKAGSKALWRKAAKVFPEYKIAEKI